MKKKIFITLSIIGLLIIAMVFILRGKKHIIKEISATSWFNENETYVLGKIEIENEEGYTIPVDKEAFIKLLTDSPQYIGQYPYTHLQATANDGYYFFNNDSMYVLCQDKENFDFGFVCCAVMYNSLENEQKYYYPAPADMVPDNSLEEEVNRYYNFDELYGTYEKCVERFYKYFSSKVVTLDDEMKTVTIKPYSYTDKKISEKHRVVLDFVNKKITEIIIE